MVGGDIAPTLNPDHIRASFSYLFLLLAAHCALFTAELPTFTMKDRITGEPLECDRCPPGTFLSSGCSSKHKSTCSPCPNGSYTQLWNHIRKCLRCGVCSLNQVVKKACTPDSDCECECKPGYYYKQDYGMCVRHSECPSGQGVQVQGTPERNTECQICSNGTYSDNLSSVQKCAAHSNCSEDRLKLVLKGSTWHDNICANCAEVNDSAVYLRKVLPSFFVHQSMSLQRLQRIVHKLPLPDGKRQGGFLRSKLKFPELQAHIRSWAASATASQIRQFLTALSKSKASGMADKLQNKLNQIDRNLAEQCSLKSQLDHF